MENTTSEAKTNTNPGTESELFTPDPKSQDSSLSTYSLPKDNPAPKSSDSQNSSANEHDFLIIENSAATTADGEVSCSDEKLVSISECSVVGVESISEVESEMESEREYTPVMPVKPDRKKYNSGNNEFENEQDDKPVKPDRKKYNSNNNEFEDVDIDADKQNLISSSCSTSDSALDASSMSGSSSSLTSSSTTSSLTSSPASVSEDRPRNLRLKPKKITLSFKLKGRNTSSDYSTSDNSVVFDEVSEIEGIPRKRRMKRGTAGEDSTTCTDSYKTGNLSTEASLSSFSDHEFRDIVPDIGHLSFSESSSDFSASHRVSDVELGGIRDSSRRSRHGSRGISGFVSLLGLGRLWFNGSKSHNDKFDATAEKKKGRKATVAEIYPWIEEEERRATNDAKIRLKEMKKLQKDTFDNQIQTDRHDDVTIDEIVIEKL